MKRRTAREYALQILYPLDMNYKEPTVAIKDFLESDEADPFLTKLVEGVINHLEEIDEMIIKHLENWSLETIATVEKTILRIATYEMTFEDEIPKEVSINEAVEIAKKFGDVKSGKFVNGILSKML